MWSATAPSYCAATADSTSTNVMHTAYSSYPQYAGGYGAPYYPYAASYGAPTVIGTDSNYYYSSVGTDPNAAQSATTNEDDDDDDDVEYDENGQRKGKKRLEMVCDRFYNMNEISVKNILTAEYFKGLYALKTYHEVIDEAHNKVKQLEAFSQGQSRMPSTAFCLLYKLFLMRLTLKQIRGMLSKKDSPYVRGLGFLYLRFVCEPKQLWDWYEPFFDDPQVFTPSTDQSRKMTMGEYAWFLLSEHNYFGYILKRLPIPLVREWQVKYAERQLQQKIAEENEKFRDDLQVGTKVLALYSEDGKYYDAVISRVLDNGNFLITYSEYGNSEEHWFAEIERARAKEEQQESQPQ